ncbi:hypothetical protein BCR43DRAFT_493467 [Syncephalastrum racemosum]|uniref:DnaJ homologue subfamily C member 28 conserved domain-containing protein n=1 Tax=Syncephalastrum racemosum TaxID=13706 RepID=A0A1X2HAL3_SYNRA|nr:hypothetical protein BCR43DRAFT_493467 [Syncephalastrum racemosum]
MFLRQQPKRQHYWLQCISSIQRARYTSIFRHSENEEAEEERQKRARQIHKEKEQPWTGEESVADSVLRMIMDKHRTPPIRIEGAARRQLPNPQLHPAQVQGIHENDDVSSQEKNLLRSKKRRATHQRRLMNARDAAIDYSMNQKYPANAEEQDDDTEEKPRRLGDIMSLAEERIRAARMRGEFDDLPGRGKPLAEDGFGNSPVTDRTEFLLNRIVQRQGAAPPWIMMQQQVDTDISQFRTQLRQSLRHVHAYHTWREKDGAFFVKYVDRVNSAIRSYNVMCPSSVRKPLLDLETEWRDLHRLSSS